MALKIRPCLFVSPRSAALIAGIINVAIGVVGLSLIWLTPAERHNLLDPVVEERTEEGAGGASSIPGDDDKSYQEDLAVEDTLKLFIEYLLPASCIFLLGLILSMAATTMSRCMTVFSFMLSTVVMVSSVAGLLTLLLSSSSSWTSGGGVVGGVPIVVVALWEIYVYWIVLEFNKFSWGYTVKEDKVNLVEDEEDGGGDKVQCSSYHSNCSHTSTDIVLHDIRPNVSS